MNREQRRKAKKNAKADMRLDAQLQLHARIALDAAAIAANDVFNMGPARAKSFRDAYETTYNEILDLIVRDDAVYAFEVLDRRLKTIVGDEFVPWDERYKVQFRRKVL